MQKSANLHGHEVDFDVEDSVWLDIAAVTYIAAQQETRLPDQWPPQKVGHSYRLGYPESMKIHGVISIDKLHKASEDRLPGQVQDLSSLSISQATMNGQLRIYSHANWQEKDEITSSCNELSGSTMTTT